MRSREKQSGIKKLLSRIDYNDRTQVSLLIAVILLIVMILVLLYFLFISKEKDKIVPDAPNYSNLEVGVVDYSSGESGDNLENISTTKLDVSYSIISNYYDEGILLSNVNTYYLDGSFIVSSGRFADIPFISSISTDGELKWLTKLSIDGYDNLYVHKVIYAKSDFYVLCFGEKDEQTDALMIKVNSTGKISTYLVIAENMEYNIKDAVFDENGNIGITFSNDNQMVVYFVDTDMNSKSSANVNTILNTSKNIVHIDSVLDNHILYLYVTSSSKYYKIGIDSVTGVTVSTSEILSGVTLDNVVGYYNGMLSYGDNKVYKYDSSNNLINTYDYDNLKVEDLSGYKVIYGETDYEEGTTTGLTNSVTILYAYIYDGYILINSSTALSKIYDIFDENLNIKKRYTISSEKYTYDEATLLEIYYINDYVYEIYSYGFDTPSIMVSRIG